MSLELANTDFKAMYRRWIYMAVAIIAAALMPLKPVFSFQDDKGIIFVRSFSMTETQLVVTQTELETGISHVKNTMSVRGLFYCYLAMLAGSVLTLLCFFNDEWRVWICTFTALVAGLYYVLMVLRIKSETANKTPPIKMSINPLLLKPVIIQTLKAVATILNNNIA